MSRLAASSLTCSPALALPLRPLARVRCQLSATWASASARAAGTSASRPAPSALVAVPCRTAALRRRSASSSLRRAVPDNSPSDDNNVIPKLQKLAVPLALMVAFSLSLAGYLTAAMVAGAFALGATAVAVMQAASSSGSGSPEDNAKAGGETPVAPAPPSPEDQKSTAPAAAAPTAASAPPELPASAVAKEAPKSEPKPGEVPPEIEPVRAEQPTEEASRSKESQETQPPAEDDATPAVREPRFEDLIASSFNRFLEMDEVTKQRWMETMKSRLEHQFQIPDAFRVEPPWDRSAAKSAAPPADVKPADAPGAKPAQPVEPPPAKPTASETKPLSKAPAPPAPHLSPRKALEKGSSGKAWVRKPNPADDHKEDVPTNDAQYMIQRANTVKENFPQAMLMGDFLFRVELVLATLGFNRDNVIAVANTCRDKATLSLKNEIEKAFPTVFHMTGLGAGITAGVIGIRSGISHSAKSVNGKERYVFFSFPHIAINSKGLLGAISRPGQLKPSSACDALATALGQIKAEGLKANAKDLTQFDENNPEYSMLKARIARRMMQDNIDPRNVDLVAITKIAEKQISDDLEMLISQAVDPATADYAIVTGVQIHNWGEKFGDSEPNLEFIASTKVSVVIDGKRSEIDINSVPGPTSMKFASEEPDKSATRRSETQR